MKKLTKIYIGELHYLSGSSLSDTIEHASDEFLFRAYNLYKELKFYDQYKSCGGFRHLKKRTFQELSDDITKHLYLEIDKRGIDYEVFYERGYTQIFAKDWGNEHFARQM